MIIEKMIAGGGGGVICQAGQLVITRCNCDACVTGTGHHDRLHNTTAYLYCSIELNFTDMCGEILKQFTVTFSNFHKLL